jgi:glycosyltransferase involved in cell wall biosynthesis
LIGVLDIALEGVTSYLFEKQNAGDLAAKLEQLIESPVKCEQFGKAARERVINNFEINLVTDQAINLYNELIKKKT